MPAAAAALMMQPSHPEDNAAVPVIFSSSSAGGGDGKRKCFLVSTTVATTSIKQVPENLHKIFVTSTFATDRCFMQVPSSAFLCCAGASQIMGQRATSSSSLSPSNPPMTLQSLFDHGIRGLMMPLKSVGVSVADVPFFLRNEGIHSILVDFASDDDAIARHPLYAKVPGNSDDDDDDDDDCKNALSPTKTKRRRAKKVRRIVSRAVNGELLHHCLAEEEGAMLSSSSTNPAAAELAMMPLPKRAVMFENICGSTFVYGYHMRDKDVVSMRCGLDAALCSSCCRSNGGPSSALKKARGIPSSSSSSSSPDSFEVFSIHGNIVLRKDPSGTVVSFKVHHHMAALAFVAHVRVHVFSSDNKTGTGCQGHQQHLSASGHHASRHHHPTTSAVPHQGAHGRAHSQHRQEALGSAGQPHGQHAQQGRSETRGGRQDGAENS